MSEEIPKVEPIDIPEYKYKSSKFDMMPKLPARMLCVASSTGGKTVLIQNLILKIYRGSFERIYIFSPSVHVDDTWSAVKTQHKVIDFQKKNKQKDLFSILLVVDDFADDPKFVRYSSLLHGLFTRGRHNAISCILSTQKYNVLAPIIRLNASALFIFRLKNMNEVNAFLEENSALVDKSTLYEMYQKAVNFAPYSFFDINTNTKDVNNMFFINFQQRFEIGD